MLPPCDSRSKENIDHPRVNSTPENLRRNKKETARGRKLYYRSGYGNQYDLQLSFYREEGSDVLARNFVAQK
jgi:hypothetical protein